MQTLSEIKLKRLLEFPVWVMGISFVIGTLLLAFYLVGDNYEIVMWGFLYVITAFGINLSVLIAYALLGYALAEYRQQLMERAALLLVNISVAILYYYIFNTWK